MVELESSSPEETERSRRSRGSSSPATSSPSAGELGAGKTTFVRGACRALGVEGPVTSPTLHDRAPLRGRARRLAPRPLPVRRHAPDAEWGDLERYFDDAVVFVEWPEAGEAFLPARARPGAVAAPGGRA